MKAIVIHEDGGPDVLRYEDVPDPEPAAGEVLVRMQFASLNHLDIWTRKGMPSVPKPRILGADGSGVVESLGADVEGLEPGQPVVINPGLEHGATIHVIGEHTQGVHAELAAVPATNVVPLRGGVSFEDAAAFPLVFETAYRMLVTRARLQAGEWVLVWGIGGGVATAAFRIAQALGAKTVVTSSSDDKLAKAKALGADVTLNHDSDDVVAAVKEAAGGGADVEAVAGRRPAGRPHHHLRSDDRPQPARGAAPRLVEAARHPGLDDGHARRLRRRLRPRCRRRHAGDRQGVPTRRGACRP